MALYLCLGQTFILSEWVSKCQRSNLGLQDQHANIVPQSLLMFAELHNLDLYNCPLHGKTNEMTCAPSSDSDLSLGNCPVWSESLLSAFWNLESLATHWVHSEDSDQTVWMPRLIWVFAGHTFILLVCHAAAQYLIYLQLHLDPQIWISSTH